MVDETKVVASGLVVLEGCSEDRSVELRLDGINEGGLTLRFN